MTSSHGQRRNRPPPETFRSDSVSRFYKTSSTMVKQVQQDHPMRRHPDRSCTYLVLRATPDEHYVQLKLALKFPRGGAASGSGSDQHLDKHWPGGAIIKMTLERATPKGKVGGGEANGKSQCWALLEEFYSKRTIKGFPL